jgi:hypothetical protein
MACITNCKTWHVIPNRRNTLLYSLKHDGQIYQHWQLGPLTQTLPWIHLYTVGASGVLNKIVWLKLKQPPTIVIFYKKKCHMIIRLNLMIIRLNISDPKYIVSFIRLYSHFSHHHQHDLGPNSWRKQFSSASNSTNQSLN